MSYFFQKFMQDQDPSDKRMTSERCAKLCAIAIANRLDEAWMGLFPVVPLCYVLRFYPNIARRYYNYLVHSKYCMDPFNYYLLTLSKVAFQDWNQYVPNNSSFSAFFVCKVAYCIVYIWLCSNLKQLTHF